jgi:hypothetical protein
MGFSYASFRVYTDRYIANPPQPPFTNITALWNIPSAFYLYQRQCGADVTQNSARLKAPDVKRSFMKTLKTLFIFLVPISLIGQTNRTLLKSWKSYPVPINQDTLYKYNSDPNDWIIHLDGNEIKVGKDENSPSSSQLPFDIRPSESEKHKLRGRRSILEVDDGYLVGFHRGEWGGNLYWFSKDGTKKYEISRHEIVQFIERDKKIYAIEGLTHLSISEGSIIAIDKKDNKWTVKEYLRLPSAPDAVQLDSKDNFVIVTSSSLFSIDKKRKIDTLIKVGMWEYNLYPSSMVIQDNKVYIGMRKGVYKFDLGTKKDEWLLPD